MHGDYVYFFFLRIFFIKEKDAGMTSTIKRNMSQYSCLRRISKVQVYLYNTQSLPQSNEKANTKNNNDFETRNIYNKIRKMLIISQA